MWKKYLILLLLLPGNFALAAISPSDVISEWRLDETSGVRGDSKEVNHLTDNNTVTSATGTSSLAASFARASSESLSRTDPTNLESLSQFSVNLWIKPTTAGLGGDYMLFSKWQHAVNNQYMFNLQATNYELYVGHSSCSGYNYSSVAKKHYITANVWKMVTVTFNAGTVKMYTNASSTGSGTVTATSIQNCAASFYLGARHSPLSVDYYDGLEDEVTFFNKELTQADIDYLYNSGVGKFYPFSTTASSSLIINNGNIIDMVGTTTCSTASATTTCTYSYLNSGTSTDALGLMSFASVTFLGLAVAFCTIFLLIYIWRLLRQ